MDKLSEPGVLPYSLIVGQQAMKTALEIAYVSPLVKGVLVTGQRGTAKSTTVRAFAQVAYGKMPVTLPIGATDDRVLGGWHVEKLMESKASWQPGLLEEAGALPEEASADPGDAAAKPGPGILYIDEVNLLDDHLVNIILDVASTGILPVQRDGADRTVRVRFVLVGTMNPEEGNLRPQLLDRFGLAVPVTSASSAEDRRDILQRVLQFDKEDLDKPSQFMLDGLKANEAKKDQLTRARQRLVDGELEPSDQILTLASDIAAEFQVEGHRAELVMVHAACALAAIEDEDEVSPGHLAKVAPLALVHRRASGVSGTMPTWSAADQDLLGRHVPSVAGS